MPVTLLQGVLAALVLMPALAGAQVSAAPSGQEATLHAMVVSALQRSPMARTLEARLDESQAARDLSAAWLAGAPMLGLSQRGDRWTDRRGRRESELSLSAPVWLPAQKSARMALADAGAAELAAQLALARLDVAGQVRRLLWEAAAACEAQVEKEDHLRHLEELASEVQRRVDGGDLARSDSLLARQEVLAARNEATAARLRAAEAQMRFRLATGMAAPAVPVLEAIADDAMPVPLRQQAAQATAQRARAAVAAARAQPDANPTVALSLRQERDGNLAPQDRSIGLTLQIPLTEPVRNRPAVTAAATQLASASAELAQAQDEAAATLALAREQVAHARQSLADARQRADAMEEHTRLIEKAFHAGERGLAELLRSRALRHEAHVALRQQRVALGQAHAGFNQALGILP